MALVFLDKGTIAGYLTKMWQRDLGTDEDPANGQWNENGANNDNIGLYGGLTDVAATQLNLNQAQQSYTPQAVICDSHVWDNTNGLNPSGSVTLTYKHSNSASTTHSTTDSIKVGVGVDIKASATIFGVGADVTTKFTFDYTHTWGTSTTEVDGTELDISQTVPLNVPSGKIYQAILTCVAQTLVVPYTAVVAISGTTETWFEDRINGHYNWMMDAGSAFANIAAWGLAGGDSSSYSSAGVTQTGTVTAQQSTQFVVKIIDVTNSAAPSQISGEEAQLPAMMRRMAISPEGLTQPSMLQGTVVQEIPIPDPT